MDKILSLIGAFELDSNRVLDQVLDVFDKGYKTGTTEVCLTLMPHQSVTVQTDYTGAMAMALSSILGQLIWIM